MARRFCFTLLSFAHLLIVFAASAAAPPTLDHLFPAGGQRGTTVAVTASGKFDAWPVGVWTDGQGVEFKPGKEKGRFDVTLSADAAPGPRLVRFHTGDGASTLRFFIVGEIPESLDAEPNDAFARPQAVTNLPVIVNGRLDKNGDVDSFAVSLKAGEWLTAEVNAHRLRSTTDPLLRLVDTNGVMLAFNHDAHSLDPAFSWRAGRDGTVVVQLMGFPFPATASVNLAGGAGYIYRLALAKRGPALEPPPDWSHATVSESEPNDARGQATRFAPPVRLAGAIDAPGDEDRFAFEAKKGAKLDFELHSAPAGSVLDAWLRIEDAAGKELAKNDDGPNPPDPKLSWTAPADGTFQVIAGSVLHRLDGRQVYRLDVAPPVAGFTAKVTDSAFTVAPGKTNSLKVTVTRFNGHDGKLRLAARDIPAGVTAEPVEASAKSGDVTLKLVAAPDAAPHGGPLRLVLVDESERETAVRHELTNREINNGVPGGYTELVINDTSALWLTVLPPQKDKP